MKELHHLVNIIPVIAKADTLTPSEIRRLKTRVPHHLLFDALCHDIPPQIMQEIMDNDIHIYSGEIDEEEDSPEVKELRVSCSSHLVPHFLGLYCAGCHSFCSSWKHNFVRGQRKESKRSSVSMGSG